jgi:hypothetical protein
MEVLGDRGFRLFQKNPSGSEQNPKNPEISVNVSKHVFKWRPKWRPLIMEEY